MPKTTIDFSPPAAVQLEELVTQLHTTKAEVVRNALSLYAFLQEELGPRKRDLAIVDGDKIIKLIAVPGFRKRRRAA